MDEIDPNCVTHHDACECRESQFKRLVEAAEKAHEVLGQFDGDLVWGDPGKAPESNLRDVRVQLFSAIQPFRKKEKNCMK